MRADGHTRVVGQHFYAVSRRHVDLLRVCSSACRLRAATSGAGPR
ncbi:hypothetical protein UA75_22995 [Actinoalloteichus sp. GBA129-24]|uniref:Uncharacterized protein n=1 Tax=Actinoalloteichus fjordicus TaxID=1612552 RepID=A0AAC9LES1_9PSEU|nr:hypothetical protein UA74_22475 [Actinoalloteichus fjordicus]APU22581.1 hypothetical protein UA75_22995 [Actinoalloteichus sp. GBA129-24]